MSTVDGQSAPGGSPSTEPAELELEAVVIPVADADRSKTFYVGLGWRLDGDVPFDNGLRVVQSTAAHAGAGGTAMTVEDDRR